MHRAIALLAMTLAVAAPAAAEPPRQLLMARVSTSGLDLRSDAGAAAMLRRLDSAATELCALPSSMLFPGNSGREHRCRRDAIASAVERLRTPQLTRAHVTWLAANTTTASPSPR